MLQALTAPMRAVADRGAVIIYLSDDPEQCVTITPEAVLKSLTLLVTAALEALDQARPPPSADTLQAWIKMAQKP